MGKRRDGRQAAMQYLFAHDLHGEVSESEINGFWELHSANPDIRKHAETVVKNILSHREEIDTRIGETLENFRFERLGTVDRNILRLAVYELLFTPEVPIPVVINEAIEIAKLFGDTQTKAFVNGVLDKIARPLRAAKAEQLKTDAANS